MFFNFTIYTCQFCVTFFAMSKFDKIEQRDDYFDFSSSVNKEIETREFSGTKHPNNETFRNTSVTHVGM